jgi:hypothetical protein
MVDLCRHTPFVGTIWLLFGVLFSICVFVGTPPKKTNIWPSICATNQKTNTQIKNGHFVMCIHVSGQRNHLFCKTNTQMRHFRVRPLQCDVQPSFVYLLIGVLEQRKYSLRL